MMIEQPLTAGDLIDHAELQKHIKTPICLDESIHSYDDARQAIQLGSGKIINMKVGRVGGITTMKRIHELCKEANVPMWCGGMLESGVGRAHNIAVTSLSTFTLPGDTAASSVIGRRILLILRYTSKMESYRSLLPLESDMKLTVKN